MKIKFYDSFMTEQIPLYFNDNTYIEGNKDRKKDNITYFYIHDQWLQE